MLRAQEMPVGRRGILWFRRGGLECLAGVGAPIPSF